MCEAPRERKRKNPPPTAHMLALLREMQQTTSPVIADGRRGYRHETFTLDGRKVRPAAISGLSWRGFAKFTKTDDRRVYAYHLTDAGRASKAAQ